MRRRVVMGLLFYPRGGSAQCARYLVRALDRREVPLSVVAGSLGSPVQESHAETFFGELDLHPVDYSAAIEAFQRGRDPIAETVPLLIWGGSPGEWEGEHPYTVARDEAAESVFFTGSRGHEDLELGLNSAGVMVAPSRNEPFGQVYLEAMASGLPVIATRSGGPPSFLNTRLGRPNGWLVAPDDEEALAAALVEAVNDPVARTHRGRNAYRQIRGEYSWDSIAGHVLRVYRDAPAGHARREGDVDISEPRGRQPVRYDRRAPRRRGTARSDSMGAPAPRPDAES